MSQCPSVQNVSCLVLLVYNLWVELGNRRDIPHFIQGMSGTFLPSIYRLLLTLGTSMNLSAVFSTLCAHHELGTQACL